MDPAGQVYFGGEDEVPHADRERLVDALREERAADVERELLRMEEGKPRPIEDVTETELVRLMEEPGLG